MTNWWGLNGLTGWDIFLNNVYGGRVQACVAKYAINWHFGLGTIRSRFGVGVWLNRETFWNTEYANACASYKEDVLQSGWRRQVATMVATEDWLKAKLALVCPARMAAKAHENDRAVVRTKLYWDAVEEGQAEKRIIREGSDELKNLRFMMINDTIVDEPIDSAFLKKLTGDEFWETKTLNSPSPVSFEPQKEIFISSGKPINLEALRGR